jgi:hypothetical protein
VSGLVFLVALAERWGDRDLGFRVVGWWIRDAVGRLGELDPCCEGFARALLIGRRRRSSIAEDNNVSAETPPCRVKSRCHHLDSSDTGVILHGCLTGHRTVPEMFAAVELCLCLGAAMPGVGGRRV